MTVCIPGRCLNTSLLLDSYTENWFELNDPPVHIIETEVHQYESKPSAAVMRHHGVTTACYLGTATTLLVDWININLMHCLN